MALIIAMSASIIFKKSHDSTGGGAEMDIMTHRGNFDLRDRIEGTDCTAASEWRSLYERYFSAPRCRPDMPFQKVSLFSDTTPITITDTTDATDGAHAGME